MQAECRNTSL